MQIFVRTCVLNNDGSSRTIVIDVEKSTTIRLVKEKIRDQTNSPLDKQRLIYAGKQLKDDFTIAEYHIQKESTLQMVERLRGCGGGRPTKVTVPLRYGGKYEKSPCCTTTVLAFKETMDKETGIRATRIKLFYNGRELENKKFLLDCIPHDPEVELSMELLG